MDNNLLKQLIEQHKRVVIPEFGAFLRKDVAQGGGLAFSPFLRKDDGVVTSAIVQAYGVESDDAKAMVNEFVVYLRNSLATTGKYHIEGVGLLVTDSNGTILLRDEPVAEPQMTTPEPVAQPKAHPTVQQQSESQIASPEIATSQAAMVQPESAPFVPPMPMPHAVEQNIPYQQRNDAPVASREQTFLPASAPMGQQPPMGRQPFAAPEAQQARTQYPPQGYSQNPPMGRPYQQNQSPYSASPMAQQPPMPYPPMPQQQPPQPQQQPMQRPMPQGGMPQQQFQQPQQQFRQPQTQQSQPSQQQPPRPMGQRAAIPNRQQSGYPPMPQGLQGQQEQGVSMGQRGANNPGRRPFNPAQQPQSQGRPMPPQMANNPSGGNSPIPPQQRPPQQGPGGRPPGQNRDPRDPRNRRGAPPRGRKPQTKTDIWLIIAIIAAVVVIIIMVYGIMNTQTEIELPPMSDTITLPIDSIPAAPTSELL